MTDLSSVKIYDDLLDDRFILDLDEESNEYTWFLGNSANRRSFPYRKKGSHLLWGVHYNNLDKPEEPVIVPVLLQDLYLHLKDLLLDSSYILKSIHINGQGMGQNGNLHYDGGYTLMVFINYKWKKSWGGDFQLLEPDGNVDDLIDLKSVKKHNQEAKVIKTIKYKPGRIVFFDGDIAHRGLAPTKPYIIRKSLVYRLTKNNLDT